MPKNHRVCGRSRCSDICKVRMWRPRDGVHWEALRRAPKMQWPVYKTFSMESFGVEPVQEIGEEELCFEARKAQWFEARSRWIKVEESRLRVENEQAFDAAVKTYKKESKVFEAWQLASMTAASR